MCIAIPGKIIACQPDGYALCDIYGVLRDINIMLLGDVSVGQWVLVHVGFAMSVIDETEALATRDALQTMYELDSDVGILINRPLRGKDNVAG